MDINEVLESENPSIYLYHYALSNGRLSPKWEKLLLEFRDAFFITSYAQDVIQGRWYEAEPILLEFKNYYGITEYIIRYARDVIKGRWFEAEEIIASDWEASILYIEELKVPFELSGFKVTYVEE